MKAKPIGIGSMGGFGGRRRGGGSMGGMGMGGGGSIKHSKDRAKRDELVIRMIGLRHADSASISQCVKDLKFDASISVSTPMTNVVAIRGPKSKVDEVAQLIESIESSNRKLVAERNNLLNQRLDQELDRLREHRDTVRSADDPEQVAQANELIGLIVAAKETIGESEPISRPDRDRLPAMSASLANVVNSWRRARQSNSSVSEIEAAKRAVIQTVTEMFETRYATEMQDLKTAQQQLDTIRQRLDLRMETRDQIIDAKVKELLKPNDTPR